MSLWPKVPLSEVLTQDTRTERITDTENEVFLTIKLYGNGLTKRNIGAGKTPKPFVGYRISVDQFVYSRIDARNGAYGMVPLELDGAVCSKDFPKFDVDAARADASYLLRIVQAPAFYRKVQDLSFGATNRQRVQESEFLRLAVPLPPLAEQRRIAAILDHAESLCVKRREVIACLDELTQAIFIEMFGNPATNPKGLPVGALGDLLESAQYGTSEKSSATGEYPVLRMNNITYKGQVDLTDLKFMDLPDDKVDRFTVSAGDILFNRTNSAELVGKTAVYRGSEKLAYAGYLVRLRTMSGNSPEYISVFLNSAYGKAVLRGMCKSIVGMANINAREVQSIQVMQPPSKLQEQFADRVSAIEEQKSVQLAALAECDALFASLQSRVFRGEV